MVYGDELPVYGHNDFTDKKECPSFKVRKSSQSWCLSDPLFKDVSFIKAFERLSYDEKHFNFLILQVEIKPFHALHRKSAKTKTNTMAKEGLGGQAVTTAIQLALVLPSLLLVSFPKR